MKYPMHMCIYIYIYINLIYIHIYIYTSNIYNISDEISAPPLGGAPWLARHREVEPNIEELHRR